MGRSAAEQRAIPSAKAPIIVPGGWAGLCGVGEDGCEGRVKEVGGVGLRVGWRVGWDGGWDGCKGMKVWGWVCGDRYFQLY